MEISVDFCFSFFQCLYIHLVSVCVCVCGVLWKLQRSQFIQNDINELKSGEKKTKEGENHEKHNKFFCVRH